ncbi:hypothetical protein CCAX7_50200 [Capsulimonas corticalis]|uniref:Uncharacterized protein n=1 Tax=Capsulimonas corticalis TaxID=2219043 RepID=A0A402CPT1_9BACT|nr:prepilin-type N-terminal cleavage/methylation domain-containing protein [Capsulimonas corticalis]BDI32969.1 hypothetical protein CCAX7_50200 [Capsulimonas corticalis]
MRHTNVHSEKSGNTTARADARAGFTLVELLVVIAISVLLFGLLLKPLVDSLSLTQQAQATAAAQDSARKTMEVVTRELGSAAYVYDNASHPFVGASAASVDPNTGYPYERFSNFLNLEIPNFNVGQTTFGHAFNAKLDFVLPRKQSGRYADPTLDNEPIVIETVNGVQVVRPTGLLLPIAPGTTMVRYFVGLQNPEKPYRNVHEGSGASNGDDNTYVLYRAQFRPQATDPQTGKYLLFDVPDESGATPDNQQSPIFDDPDFFRKVSTSDVNWLDAGHNPYTAAQVTAHNNRLVQWEKIAQHVIGAPKVDLLMLPHNSDGSIAYDASGTFKGIAHYGAMQDSVIPTSAYPVVNTSVTFKPTITNDATPATNTDYVGAGVPEKAADNNGLPFIPSVYRTEGQAWNQPFTINFYSAINGAAADPNALPAGAKYRIERSPIDNTSLGIAAGDLVEYFLSATPAAVYNVTYGAPVKGIATPDYVPAVVNPDSGTISFAVNALPDPDLYTGTDLEIRTKRANTSWDTTVGLAPSAANSVDLKVLPKSPLVTVTNAIVTPGSVRVYGPKREAIPTANPGVAETILYTPVGPGESPGDNEYLVDYEQGTILFNPSANGLPVSIVWQYQSNLTVVDQTKPRDLSNPAAPMSVRVDYQSRDLIGVTIGVRLYPTSGSLAQIVSASSNVKVGNSNR